MRKFIFLLLLHLLIINNAILKGQWVRLNGPAGAAVNSFAISGNSIYSGTLGGVYLSTDNGSNWVQLKNGLPENTSFISLAVKGNIIFAGTYGQGVFMSTDNGVNWDSANTGIPVKDAWVNALVFSGNNIFAGIYDGNFGRVYLSDDNGSSWKSVSNGLPEFTFMNALAVSSSRIFAATSDGVYRSTDNGSNWARAADTLLKGVFKAFAVNGDTIYAGSDIGAKGVFLSTDGGTNWELAGTGLGEVYLSALAVNGNHLFAAAYSYGVYHSTDKGKSWNAVNNGLPEQNIQVLAVMNNSVFAGTSSAGVFISEDNGTSWKAANNGMNGSSVFAMFIQNNIILAGTGSGIFVSTDNGESWAERNKGMGNSIVYSFIHSGNDIFALASDDKVFRSTDYGTGWQAVNKGLPERYINSIAAADGHIFAGTDSGVFVSTDYGDNWKIKNKGMYAIALSDSILRITTLAALGNVIFAGSAGRDDAGRIFLSADFGENWITSMNNTASRMDMIALAAAGSKIFASYTYGQLYNPVVVYSADTGKTWTGAYEGFPQRTDAGGFFVIKDNIFAFTNEGIFRFYEDSTKWINAGDKFPDRLLSVADNNDYVFAGTRGFSIWRRPLSEVVTSADKKQNYLPSRYFLGQNYPNPFNPLTTIDYSIPFSSYVELKVYDILGREVSVLVNKEQAAGSYRLQFDGSYFPSGVYFYRIKAGEYTGTRKFLLLK